jgi:hypothetical protein
VILHGGTPLCISNSLRAFLLYTAITYKVVIVTGKQLGGSTTTANVWMILAGEIKDTGTIDVPKGECEFRFQVRLVSSYRRVRLVPSYRRFYLESSLSQFSTEATLN